MNTTLFPEIIAAQSRSRRTQRVRCHQKTARPGIRAQQLADIAASGDEDNSACAEADQFREFPPGKADARLATCSIPDLR